MKKLFRKCVSAVKTFFTNLKIMLKIHNGALIKTLAQILIPVVIGLGIDWYNLANEIKSWDPVSISLIVSFILMALSMLVWIRYDYKEAVKLSAKKEIAKANKKGYKERKAAAKKSEKAQNREAEIRHINSKYN